MSSTHAAILALLQASAKAQEAAMSLIQKMLQEPAPAAVDYESVSDGWPEEELDFGEEEATSVAETVVESVVETASVDESVQTDITTEGKVYPVFCTAGEEVIRLRFANISDFNNFVAFHYRMKQDIGNTFYTMSKENYINYLCTIPLEDGKTPFVSPKQAKHIYNSMKSLTDSIGKEIIVAVAKSQGGGLEIRRVTGPYRFNIQGIKGDGGGYWHQFPTQLVRKLTQEESDAVSFARRKGDSGMQSMNWTIRL
jgi:hypothetical protein